jgi:hypothetical protein
MHMILLWIASVSMYSDQYFQVKYIQKNVNSSRPQTPAFQNSKIISLAIKLSSSTGPAAKGLKM